MTIVPEMAVTRIETRQDLSRWTRAHADAPGLTWSVTAGPGGTLVIAEHDRDRRQLPCPVPAAAHARGRS